jgi:DNA-binding XRE family transcriptional regulator
MAADMNMSRTSLVNIEQGKQSITLYVAYQMAKYLDIELNMLTGGFEL